MGRDEEGNAMTVNSARDVVDRYFTAMVSKDFATMRTLLHDDVSFKGALGTTAGADDYIKGIEQITANTTALNRRMLFAEGENVCQIYDMVVASPAVTVPISQWLTVRDNRIATLQVFFDPRLMIPPSTS